MIAFVLCFREDAAAAKLQAIQRGNLAQKEVQGLR